MSDPIELAEAIQQLRDEISQAMRSGEGHRVQFELNSINMEFQTVIQREGNLEAGGKLKFLVLDLEGKATGKYSKHSIHKISLSLEPRDNVATDASGKPRKPLLSD